jgi:ankyrin repeat protein
MKEGFIMKKTVILFVLFSLIYALPAWAKDIDIDKYINQIVDNGTALIWAVKEGHTDIVKALLARGIDKEAQKHDLILMKNGDVLSGHVLTEQLKIKSSYASLVIEAKKVESIDYDKNNLTTIFLRNGDKVSGVIENQSIEIKLLNMASKTTIPNDKIKFIKFKSQIRNEVDNHQENNKKLMKKLKEPEKRLKKKE